MMIETKTINELRNFISSWVSGSVRHLYLSGISGSGKTYTLRTVLEAHPRVEWVGTSTPFSLYKALFRAQCKHSTLIVLDDADGVLHSRKGMEILKAALSSDDERTISWDSRLTGADKDAPKTFKLSARLCIVTNSYGARNQHMKAIIGRCMALFHAPEPEDILKYSVENGILDKSICDQIIHIGYPRYLNIRDLVTLMVLVAIGDDWEKRYRAMLEEYT